MTARLILHLDDDRIAFPLEEGENVIGRKKACDIYVRDGSLSKFHARILRQGERLEVIDAGSRNGTLVNGDPITPEDGPIQVIDGDEIQCGKLTFLVEGAGGAPAGRQAQEARPPVLVHLDTNERWELEGSQTLGIGSRAQNHVCLNGTGISRFHAELCPEGGGWVVKDLGSRNGVYVNEQQVDVHTLAAGDVVKIGTVSLRYDVPSGAGVPQLAEVLADPRKRLYVIGGLVLLLLLVGMAFIGPSGPGPGGGGGSDDLEARFMEAAGAMMEGRHDAAQEQFKRLKEDKPEAELRSWVRSFDQVSRSLEDYEDPLAFDWDRAESSLKDASKLSGLPSRLKTWVEERVAWVESGKRAYALLEEGGRLAQRSVEAAGKRDFKQAFALQREARSYLERIDGPLAQLAQDKIEKAWLPVLKASVQMIRAFMRPKSKPPHWGRAKALIEDLLPLTMKVQERTNLRRYLALCSSNMEDEELYRAAIRIIERGEVEFHPQAADFLRKVNQSSSIYPDAQAILSWLRADELVRQADQAFEDGRGEYSRRLLNEARDQHDSFLGDQARESIDRRLLQVNQVLRRWERAERFGTRVEALKLLEEIVTLLEDKPQNFYRRMAQRQFDHVKAALSKDVSDNLQKGLERLRDAWTFDVQGRSAAESTLEAFERVRVDPNHKRENIITIKNAVSDGERSTRFLYNAEKIYKQNREDLFEDLLVQLQLLRTWLPPTEQQKKASELYLLVKERWDKIQRFRNPNQRLVAPPPPPPADDKKPK
ncbi:MAG: FHA domain-containing protein [Planctomycetota bacterium]